MSLSNSLMHRSLTPRERISVTNLSLFSCDSNVSFLHTKRFIWSYMAGSIHHHGGISQCNESYIKHRNCKTLRSFSFPMNAVMSMELLSVIKYTRSRLILTVFTYLCNNYQFNLVKFSIKSNIHLSKSSWSNIKCISEFTISPFFFFLLPLDFNSDEKYWFFLYFLVIIPFCTFYVIFNVMFKVTCNQLIARNKILFHAFAYKKLDECESIVVPRQRRENFHFSRCGVSKLQCSLISYHIRINNSEITVPIAKKHLRHTCNISSVSLATFVVITPPASSISISELIFRRS